MKSKLLLLAIAASALLFGGCASTIPTGAVFTNVTVPVAASDSHGTSKVGVSKCKSFVGLVTVGDASIEAAKKNGGIKKVSSVDWKARSILGLVGEYECVVRGE